MLPIMLQTRLRNGYLLSSHCQIHYPVLEHSKTYIVVAPSDQLQILNTVILPKSLNLAKSPEYFEDLLCGLVCFWVYRLRTSRGYLWQALFQTLFQIEDGIYVPGA